MDTKTFLGSYFNNRKPSVKPILVALIPILAVATGSMAYGSIRYAGLGNDSPNVPVVVAGSGASSHDVAAVASPVDHPLDAKGYTAWKQPVPTVSQQGAGFASENTSFGVGLPVKSALEMILPKGWHIYAKPGVSGDAPVTWKAKDEPWTIPLTAVLRQAGLNAVVNWPHQALMISVRPVPNTPALNTKGYTAWAAGVPTAKDTSGLPSNFHVGPTKMVSPPLQGVTPIFALNQGDLILTDLQKWAKQSGWTVVWQVPEDWQVPNTTTFSGNFQKSVSQVIQALSANGANVHAVFHTANNTVVISGAGGGE